MYSVNTKDKDIMEAQQCLRQKVLSHEYVLQMHGFYMDKEEKTMRFDIVVSFNAPDRKAVYKAVVDDVQNAFPDYQLQIAMDTDFAEK